MSWRSVLISNPARLRIKHNALVIEQESKVSIPLEDIAVILLDNREITLTHAVLSLCADHGVCIYATGQDHHPNGIFQGFLQHTRTVKMFRLQQSLSLPKKKQLHACLVTQKVINQARCLEFLGKAGAPKLHSLAKIVRSGDPDSIESQSASFYFTKLCGNLFHRRMDSWINASLNYGYAVIRGAIARSLVLHGLHPVLGIFHDSEQNAFNLADDLIEPFRPIVDLHVVSNYDSTKTNLSTEDKAGLVSILNLSILMGEEKVSVLTAIEMSVHSLQRVFRGIDRPAALRLPQLLELAHHEREI